MRLAALLAVAVIATLTATVLAEASGVALVRVTDQYGDALHYSLAVVFRRVLLRKYVEKIKLPVK